jgi:predicted transcriptional regulator
MITPEECRLRRAALGLTQEQLAALAGLHVRTVASFEGERASPRHTTAMAVLRALRAAEAAA